MLTRAFAVAFCLDRMTSQLVERASQTTYFSKAKECVALPGLGLGGLLEICSVSNPMT